MALPLLLSIPVITFTALSGADNFLLAAKSNREAKTINENAEDIIEASREDMEYYRSSTEKYISDLGKTKLLLSSTELNKFVETYSKIKSVNLKDSVGLNEIRDIGFDQNNIKEMKSISVKAGHVLQNGIAGVGAGALLGWGVYGGISTFATAGTGTAICTLSGVAAANATLAWLGGGSIAAGGLGITGGITILGGLIAGPALMIMGGLTNTLSKKNCDNAYSNLAEAREFSEKVYTAGMELEVISRTAVIINANLKRLRERMQAANATMADVVARSVDWNDYSDAEKRAVAIAVKYAMTAKSFLDMPLLKENGVLTDTARKLHEDYQHTINSRKSNIDRNSTLKYIRQWKNENVIPSKENMCIIDPMINREILQEIKLSEEACPQTLIFAAVNKQNGKITCYTLVERDVIDLNDIKIL